MGYTCTKPMRVQVSPGKVEMRMPGEPVPEAETWANPGIWIKRGYIQADDQETAVKSGYAREKLLPAREANAEDVKRGTASVVPEPGKPLPGYQGQGNVASDGEGKGLSSDQDSKSELMSLKREDMEELATEHGVEDPGGYPNKGELADAILKATSAE